MPIGLRTPYPVIELNKLHLCILIGLLVDKLLKDVNVNELKP